MQTGTLKNKIYCILVIVLLLSLSYTSIQADHDKPPYESLSSNRYQYHTYPEMTDELQRLVQNHSDIMSLSSIGKTYEGRDIWVVTLSDNVETNENEPGVLLMGAHHGDEKPSFEVLIFFINHIVEMYSVDTYDNDGDGLFSEDPFDGHDNDNDGSIDEDPDEEQIRNAVDNTQIYIIPMVNPDGVEFEWRKNRAPNYGPDGTADEITSYGVDLNRNYGYKWNIPYVFPEEYYLEWLLNEQSWIYRGEEPFCENETKAVKQFVETHSIEISLSYHDYGEWMIFPWMHTSRNTPHEPLFRDIGYDMADINGYELKIYGQYGERAYLIPRYCGTPGSSENWLYGEHEIIAYTIELCRRRTEYNENKVFEACWKHVGVNLYVCERAQTIEQDKKDMIQNQMFHNICDRVEDWLCDILVT